VVGAVTVFALVGSLILIVLASELFTNAVEWAGHRLRLASGATGSLLAALGTSLPETAVVVVALVSGGATAQRVAIGAVIGSSFLLITLGAAATGLAALARRGRRRLQPEAGQVRRDLGVALSALPCAAASTWLSGPERLVVGVLLLLLYAGYVRATLAGGEPSEERPEPLHVTRWRGGDPAATAIALQLAVASALLVVGSALFVHAVESAASGLGIDALVLAVLVVPLATELPETVNSVLWVRSGDDSLALGNILGSVAFQACVLSFVGLSFTTWKLGTSGLVGAGCSIAAGLYLLGVLRHGSAHAAWLTAAAVPWLGFGIAEVATRGGLG
jgi:cation:H+ antiporter